MVGNTYTFLMAGESKSCTRKYDLLKNNACLSITFIRRGSPWMIKDRSKRSVCESIKDYVLWKGMCGVCVRGLVKSVVFCVR